LRDLLDLILPVWDLLMSASAPTIAFHRNAVEKVKYSKPLFEAGLECAVVKITDAPRIDKAPAQRL
jgi:hypothetical protein